MQKIAFFNNIINHEYLQKENPRQFEQLLDERLNLLQEKGEILRNDD